MAETPNNIRSKQFARVLDLVSEGEIEGLVDGLKSVYLNGTPLQNPDGSNNFQNIVVDYRYGTQSQSYLEGFPSSETLKNTGLPQEILYATPVTKTITSSNVDRVRITLSIPSLFNSDDKGNIFGNYIQYKLSMQSNGGGFVDLNGTKVPRNVTLTSSTYTTGSVMSLEFEGYATFTQTNVEGSYSLQYKSTSSGTWITAATKNLYSNPERFWIDEFGYSYGGDDPTTRINATVNNLANDTYNIRIIKNSGAGAVGALNYLKYTEWVPTRVISGKTTSGFKQDHEVILTGSPPWDIKVTKLSADVVVSTAGMKLVWDSYTEIIDGKFRYPNSAYFGLQIDSSQFAGVPARAYDLKLIKVKIPSNYNPIERTYTGLWDGTFTTAWSDNPAWCFYDLITNTRYGLGDSIDPNLVDKYTLYTIGQYCDELVSDGFGGLEPRMTCNIYFQVAEDAIKVLNNLASVFRGMLYWSNGTISAVQDAPEDVHAIFNNSDVIDGVFNYTGTHRDTRHTVINVTWNDPNDEYKQKIEYVEDSEGVATYGILETEVFAVGCTSRGQAHRVGKWVLYTERYETETVNFRTALKGTSVAPGKIIQTSDTLRAGERLGGRVLASTATSVTVDAPMTLVLGKTYTLSLALADGSIEDKVVTNAAGVHTTLTFATPTTTAVAKHAVWILSYDQAVPEKWRVISVSESESIYTINAIAHYDGKFDFVENNLILVTPQISSFDPTTQSPVAEVKFTEELYQATPTNQLTRLNISWLAPTRATRYQILLEDSNGDQRTEESFYPSIDFYNIVEGTYTAYITAYNVLGIPSPLTEHSYTVIGRYIPPDDVTGLVLNTLGENSYLAWSPVTDIDMSHYKLKFAPVTTGATWGSSSVLVERISTPSTSVTVPTMVGTYLIKSVDAYGVESTNATLVTSNIASLLGLNVVETVVEQPTFAGTKTDTIVVSNTLRLAGTTSGEYLFDNAVDLGSVLTSRLTSNISASGSDTSNTMDDWVTLSSVSYLDNTDVADWGVELYVRKTNDNPAGSPTWSSWSKFSIGDYTARAFEFKAILTSVATTITPVISVLEVTVDMSDRVHGENDLACGTGGLTVTYTPAFKNSPSIAIAAQGMATGDYYEITSKSATGFTIIFKNAGGSGVARTFDYVAKGYGYVS